MQFSVPQFTDVEDKIIAGMSFKQFGIIFGVGIAVFVMFTLTGSIIVTVFSGILLGIPGLFMAFGRINGRPIYASLSNFVKYAFGTKLYVFHKQALTIPDKAAATVMVHEETPTLDRKSASVRIKELNYLLQQQASEEAVLLDRLRENKLLNRQ